MSVEIEVLEVARQEFDEAYVYYESARAGLGGEFREEIKRQVMKIKEHPDAWMLVSPGIRKCLGKRFPYDVVYQKTDAGILILALAHKHRRPLYWRERARQGSQG